MVSVTPWMICWAFMGSMPDGDELAALKAENARLIALLESHGIEWRMPTPAGNLPSPASASEEPSEPSRLSTHEKVDLFRRLFR